MKIRIAGFLAVIALAAVVVTCYGLVSSPAILAKAVCVGVAMLGATVTIGYTYPVAGVTAPTAGQAANCNMVCGTIIADADGDTTATVTHNMALTAAQLAAFTPLPAIYAVTAAGRISAWIPTSLTANACVYTKTTTSGSGAAPIQAIFQIARPNSLFT